MLPEGSPARIGWDELDVWGEVGRDGCVGSDVLFISASLRHLQRAHQVTNSLSPAVLPLLSSLDSLGHGTEVPQAMHRVRIDVFEYHRAVRTCYA